ncbi:tripartite tricarboxylate transporter TctB family protein [Virgibacillus sp. W0181]|uniref:tripartite tricarboxylate transporter TctB family protein n=1 Tax=Virgibacillus sp. W0181 TaxID=3391581 RepID=UPI003F44AE6B
MIKSDKTMAMIIFMFAIFMLIMSFSISNQPFAIVRDDSAFFPQVWSIVLIGLSILLFLQGRKRDKEEKKAITALIVEKRQVYYMLLATVGYVSLIGSLGYILITFIFLTITISILGKDQNISKLRILAISAIITLSTYFIFSEILKVFLPMGNIF